MIDIVPMFRSAMRLMPLDALQEMRDHLETAPVATVAVEKAILDISIEILKRKWGCRL